MSNSTVPHKIAGNQLTADEVNDIVDAINSKQDTLNNTDGLAEGSNNKYFTAARAIASVLAGLGFSDATAVAASDTIVQAIGKLQAQVSALDGGSGTSNPTSIKVNSPLQTQPGGNIYVLGDSIGAGEGASISSKRFSSLVSAALGFTESNYATSGAKASDVNLSNIPIKGGSDKYIFIEYGTNEANASTTTSDFQTNLTAIINNALSKGWAASDLVLFSVFGVALYTPGSASDLRHRSFNAVTKALALANGCIYVESYDVINNLLSIGDEKLSVDTLHPNDAGHALIAKIALASLPTLYSNDGQAAIINGITDIKSLRLKNFNSVSGKEGHTYLLGVDAAGNVGVVNAIKDEVVLNKTYLNGALIHKDVSGGLGQLPTGFDLAKDIDLPLNTRLFVSYSNSLYAYMQVDSNLNVKFSTNYSNSGFDFFVSGGTSGNQVNALSITPAGVVGVNKGFLHARLTGAQRDAIVSPTEGFTIWNTNTKKLNVFNGTAWEQVTSA